MIIMICLGRFILVESVGHFSLVKLLLIHWILRGKNINDLIIFKTDTLKAKCGSSSSACKKGPEGQYIGLGLTNDRLALSAQEPVLHYDTDLFHTSIHFRCNRKQRALDKGRLVMFEHVKNHYYFDYFTSKACITKVNCKASEALGVYDLSSLKGQMIKMKAKDPSQTIFFSLCQGLPANPETRGCPPDSAICQIFSNGSKPISLGVPFKPPEVVYPSGMKLDYEGGSPCRGHPDRPYNSSIYFSCHPLIYPGRPKIDFKDKDGCHFNFR